MHLSPASSHIKTSDFCETDIVFKVDAIGLQPFMKTLAAYLKASTFNDLSDDFIIGSQLYDVFKEDA